MRRKERKHYPVGVAEVYEVARDMATVAVKNEKTPVPARLVYREAVEDLLSQASRSSLLFYPEVEFAIKASCVSACNSLTQLD